MDTSTRQTPRRDGHLDVMDTSTRQTPRRLQRTEASQMLTCRSPCRCSLHSPPLLTCFSISIPQFAPFTSIKDHLPDLLVVPGCRKLGTSALGREALKLVKSILLFGRLLQVRYKPIPASPSLYWQVKFYTHTKTYTNV